MSRRSWLRIGGLEVEVTSDCLRTAPPFTISFGGSTRGIVRCTSATGRSSRPGWAVRGSCPTWLPIARKPGTSPGTGPKSTRAGGALGQTVRGRCRARDQRPPAGVEDQAGQV